MGTIFALLTFELAHRVLCGIRDLLQTPLTEEIRDASPYCMRGCLSAPVCPNVRSLLQSAAVSALRDRAGGLAAVPEQTHTHQTARLPRGQLVFGLPQPLFVRGALEE
jgi:hypothetical protein